MNKLPAILYGWPRSLNGKPNRRERWLKAKEEHRLMCKRLGKGTPFQQAISAQSPSCKRRKPCGQGWCPQCQFLAQEKITTEFSPALRRFLRDMQREAKKSGKAAPQAWAVSFVDERMAVKRGELNVLPVKQKSWVIRKRLDNSALADAICFLGVDTSLNIEKRKKPKWQVHWYGIIFAETDVAIRDVFVPIFGEAQNKWHTPVWTDARSPEEIRRTARYVLKPNITRRGGYEGRNKRKQTAKNELKANEKVEAAEFLWKLGFKDRLLLRGVKIVRGTLIRTNLFPHQNKLKKHELAMKQLLRGSPGLFGQSWRD